MLQVFERQFPAETSRQNESVETAKFVENLSSGPSRQFLDRQKHKSRRPYSLFERQSRNMGFKDGPSKERFRKSRSDYIPT